MQSFPNSLTTPDQVIPIRHVVGLHSTEVQVCTNVLEPDTTSLVKLTKVEWLASLREGDRVNCWISNGFNGTPSIETVVGVNMEYANCGSKVLVTLASKPDGLDSTWIGPIVVQAN